MKKVNFFILGLLGIFIFLSSCTEKNDSDLGLSRNKLFVVSDRLVEHIKFKSSPVEQTITKPLSIGVAVEASETIIARFRVDLDLINKFKENHPDLNHLYAFPFDQVVIEDEIAVIKKGSVASTPTLIHFGEINNLDPYKEYVLPVHVDIISGVESIGPDPVIYYVFERGALIDVVPNIASNDFPIAWKNNVSNLRTITVEALINATSWDGIADLKNPISTIFGVEDVFLLRVGDDGRRNNELFLTVGKDDKWPKSYYVAGLPTNQWVHIAIVWDAETGDRIMYYDGVEKQRDKGAVGSVDLTENCFVGGSAGVYRWFNGAVSEMRIWNKHRTPEEIINNKYSIEPSTEGLLAYWKFNEGTGDEIKDYSGNENNLKSREPLTWIPVSLPVYDFSRSIVRK